MALGLATGRLRDPRGALITHIAYTSRGQAKLLPASSCTSCSVRLSVLVRANCQTGVRSCRGAWHPKQGGRTWAKSKSNSINKTSPCKYIDMTERDSCVCACVYRYVCVCIGVCVCVCHATKWKCAWTLSYVHKKCDISCLHCIIFFFIFFFSQIFPWLFPALSHAQQFPISIPFEEVRGRT